MQQKTTRIGIVALAAWAAVGCFSDDPEGLDDTGVDLRGETLVKVRVRDNFFEPANITIDQGTTVRWIKSDTDTYHTITPDGHSAWQRFDTDVPNDTFEAVLQNTGEFPYFCEPHRVSDNMVGSIEVQ